MDIEKKRNRIRNNLKRLNEKKLPYLSVHKTNQHIYAQIVNCEGKVLAQFSTLSKDFKLDKTYNVKAAFNVGEEIGIRAKQAGIEQVVFDRSGYIYHGKIKAIAEGARNSIKI